MCSRGRGCLPTNPLGGPAGPRARRCDPCRRAGPPRWPRASRQWGVYRRPSSKNDPSTLDLARVSDTYGLSVSQQLFDGLVQFDQTLSITRAKPTIERPSGRRSPRPGTPESRHSRLHSDVTSPQGDLHALGETLRAFRDRVVLPLLVAGLSDARGKAVALRRGGDAWTSTRRWLPAAPAAHDAVGSSRLPRSSGRSSLRPLPTSLRLRPAVGYRPWVGFFLGSRVLLS
jgi:hypothetical protein